MARPKAPCGTDAAYRRHLRNTEPVDDACRKAHALAGRGSRTAAAPAKSSREVPARMSSHTPADEASDDQQLIIDTLRTAFVTIAESDPTKLAPIAREFRAAVQAAQAPDEQPKELSLADQLAEARAARAARSQGEGATS